MHVKLEQELKIETFLANHIHHDNYKDIRKDVSKVNDMVAEAQERNIDIEQSIIQKVNDFTSKIISERNLRKQRDLFLGSISTCDQDKVNKLQGLIDTANKFQVEKPYIEQADKLTSQMSGNIKARETLQILQDYPERVYPEPEDPKKKDKKAPPPKKKKKKDNFPTPEWALELDAVIAKTK